MTKLISATSQDTEEAVECRLDEYDRVEWLDVARKLVPGITEAVFETMWEEFVDIKRSKQLN
jgi:hypothetical protein